MKNLPAFYLFISLLLFTLTSFSLYPFIFFYFDYSYLFSTSYNKFDIFFFILCIVFYLKGYFSLSLSLSLSLSQFVFHFLFDFFFLLYPYFRLINFYVNWNSTLGWCDLVLCFKLLFFYSLWLLNIILLHYTYSI